MRLSSAVRARQIIANVAVDGNSKANAGGISVTVIRTSAAECLVSNCNQSGAIGFLNGRAVASPAKRSHARRDSAAAAIMSNAVQPAVRQDSLHFRVPISAWHTRWRPGFR